MTLAKVLSQVKVSPDKESIRRLGKAMKESMGAMTSALRAHKIKADVFVGGSFAKGTVLASDSYDIDVFVRFDTKYEDISKLLEKAVAQAGKTLKKEVVPIHGSRDYFRLIYGGGIIVEFIPVVKIKKPEDARNVTDLSYFHVRYIRKALRKETERNEVLLAKQFCKAQRVYGAESYINGFSGYALECLIAYYGGFVKMLRALSVVHGQIVLDPEKKYRNAHEALLSLNENKRQGPIVLVDPTWKERNVLAALREDTFKEFQNAAVKFLKEPSISFFIIEPIRISDLAIKAKRMKADFVKVHLRTNRQEGDIAGTKLRKCARFLGAQLSQSYAILDHAFVYGGSQDAHIYFIVKDKKDLERRGPPAAMEKHAAAFRKEHKDAYVKKGILHARISSAGDVHTFLKTFSKVNKAQLASMSIVAMNVE